jgi:peptide/nickel transport system substrate-binding protein
MRAFFSLPYWTQNYVGLGAYRLEEWAPGAHLQGVAFDNYALGRPKIERIRVMFSGNRDAVLASLLAGGASATLSDAIGLAQAAVLEREWGARGTGTVLSSTTDVGYIQIQFKPEVVNPRALLDLRVRRALVHAIDRQALADAIVEGKGRAAEAYVAPEHMHFAEIDRVITKYPYDLRRADQLLSEAGLVKQADGFYRGATSDPFELRILGESEKELVILADSFRRAGINAGIDHLTPALVSDRELQTLYPALSVRSNHFEPTGFFVNFTTGRIASAQTRWTGSNRGGYSNPEFDRLFDMQEASLDEAERSRIDIALARLVSEDVPGIPTYYQLQFDAHASSLRGPTAYPSDTDRTWNMHLWEWAG